MSEDASKATAEQLLIHLEPAWERHNWCKWLGCSEAELEHAVTYVGHDPDNVRRFLRQARHHRCIEDSGRDAHDPDEVLRELAGER